LPQDFHKILNLKKLKIINGARLVQGVTTQTFIFHFALAGRNMQASFGFKVIDLGILKGGFFTYDPWIWSKVTSLSSTASVLRDGKISIKFHEFIQNFFFQNI
jgi:hypothetical protein